MLYEFIQRYVTLSCIYSSVFERFGMVCFHRVTVKMASVWVVFQERSILRFPWLGLDLQIALVFQQVVSKGSKLTHAFKKHIKHQQPTLQPIISQFLFLFWCRRCGDSWYFQHETSSATRKPLDFAAELASAGLPVETITSFWGFSRFWFRY